MTPININHSSEEDILAQLQRLKIETNAGKSILLRQPELSLQMMIESIGLQVNMLLRERLRLELILRCGY